MPLWIKLGRCIRCKEMKPLKQVDTACDECSDEIDEALENRWTWYVEWYEPYPACGPEGNQLDAHITHRMNVHDAINVVRKIHKDKGKPIMGHDKEFLLDFIAIHWARIIKAEPTYEQTR